MSILAENLKKLMSQRHINPSELARHTGIAQPIIHRLMTGQNTNPKLATIKPIAQHFGVNISQLIGEDHLPEPSNTSKDHRVTKVPVVNWGDLDSWPQMMAKYLHMPETEFVATDANVSDQAYSIVVDHNELAPLFPRGTQLIIEPKLKPVDQDFVLVHTAGESNPSIHQVVLEGNRVLLRSVAGFDRNNMKPLMQGDRFLGVMAQAKLDFHTT